MPQILSSGALDVSDERLETRDSETVQRQMPLRSKLCRQKNNFTYYFRHCLQNYFFVAMMKVFSKIKKIL